MGWGLIHDQATVAGLGSTMNCGLDRSEEDHCTLTCALSARAPSGGTQMPRPQVILVPRCHRIVQQTRATARDRDATAAVMLK